MATYLITGGAGFIGSNLVRALLADGQQVRVLDDFSSGFRSNLDEVAADITLNEGSVANPAAVDAAMDGADYVLHQAAIPSVPRSVDDPESTDRANVFGTLVVLQAARKFQIKRVVLASSSSVYGETEILPKAENHFPEPISPYGVSKLTGEYYLKAFHKCYGLPTVSLRDFNVFGPRQDPKSDYAAVIPKFVTAALRGDPVTIFGDGHQTRDFSYVDNSIEANLLACVSDNAPGNVFNIACGVRTSLLQLVEAIENLLGRKMDVHHAEERAGDIKHSYADISLAQQTMGYGAKVNMMEGLKKCIGYYEGLANA